MSTTLKRIDEHEFDKLASETKLRENAREMARSVLVEGKTMVETAALFGTSKQRVSLAVGSIRRVHQSSETRSGWVQLELQLPERLAAPFSHLLNALNASNSDKAKEKTLRILEKALARALVAIH